MSTPKCHKCGRRFDWEATIDDARPEDIFCSYECLTGNPHRMCRKCRRCEPCGECDCPEEPVKQFPIGEMTAAIRWAEIHGVAEVVGEDGSRHHSIHIPTTDLDEEETHPFHVAIWDLKQQLADAEKSESTAWHIVDKMEELIRLAHPEFSETLDQLADMGLAAFRAGVEPEPEPPPTGRCAECILDGAEVCPHCYRCPLCGRDHVCLYPQVER